MNKFGVQQSVRISVGKQILQGDLNSPENAEGIILFAHGSGSSRLSPRNRYVAQQLNQAGFGTLLFDLLTSEEEAVDAATGEHRFNIGFLAERLVGATDWIMTLPENEGLSLGYFGASTGAAAALVASTRLGYRVEAVVSRGGRPDLAGAALSQIQAPTLLIVGELDEQVMQLNIQASHHLQCEKELLVIPGATHLFEEAGTLEKAAKGAVHWFSVHLNRS
jgi:putative phosphoribosyl transferase